MAAGVRIAIGCALTLRIACVGPVARAAEASGTAQAIVVAPIAIAETDDLDFGVVLAGDDGGTVELSGTGGVTYGGGARAGCGGSGGCPVPHTAGFSVTGEANRAYTVVIPDSITLHSDIGAGSMMVDSLHVQTASRPSDGSVGVLDKTGNDSLRIGGRLLLPGGTPPARYRTTILIMVNYS